MTKIDIILYIVGKLIRKAQRRDSVDSILSNFNKTQRHLEEVAKAELERSRKLRKKADDLREKANTSTFHCARAEMKARKLKDIFGE